MPAEHVTAETDEVLLKLEERVAAMGGLFRCYLCGCPILSPEEWDLDHVCPLVLGGPHSTGNLEPACTWCNLGKGGRSLEELLGTDAYEAFLAAGWPPPFTAMRDRPVAELWARSPMVARLFARRPREVSTVAFGPWGGHGGRDAAIARVLAAQDDPWRAASLRWLAPRVGLRFETSLTDNYWLRAMGLNDRPGMTPYHDNRLEPSGLIMPVRIHGVVRGYERPCGVKAFRLRTGVDPIGVLEGSTRRLTLRFPDQDEDCTSPRTEQPSSAA